MQVFVCARNEQDVAATVQDLVSQGHKAQVMFIQGSVLDCHRSMQVGVTAAVLQCRSAAVPA